MFLLILEIDTPSGSRKTLYPLRKLTIFNGVLIFETLPRGTWRLDQGAGLIGATVGSFLVLFIWNRFVAPRAPAAGDIREPGSSPRRWL
jgi:hypothetical protein